MPLTFSYWIKKCNVHKNLLSFSLSFPPLLFLISAVLAEDDVRPRSFPLGPLLLSVLGFSPLPLEGLLGLDGGYDRTHLGADPGRGQGLDGRGGVPGVADGGADAPLKLLGAGEGER